MNEMPLVQRAREKNIYKNPNLDDCVYIAHPYGKQCYAWFTQGTCYMVDIYSKIPKEFKVNVSDLDGTVVYGTLVFCENVQCFLMDDIYYHKHEPVNMPYLKKRELFVYLLSMNIRHYDTNCFFVLPLMSTEFTHFKPIYKMHSIKIIHSSGTFHYIEQDQPHHFHVRSTSKSDIYELYKGGVLQSIAHVDTYACSLMLNKLFRHVGNIEDSDDETFVEKDILMECKWNESFKKWTPVKKLK